jgi:hypothetical protein
MLYISLCKKLAPGKIFFLICNGPFEFYIWNPFHYFALHPTKFFSYTLPLSKALQTADCDLVSAPNHISDIVAQLKDVRNTSQGTFHDI